MNSFCFSCFSYVLYFLDNRTIELALTKEMSLIQDTKAKEIKNEWEERIEKCCEISKTMKQTKRDTLIEIKSWRYDSAGKCRITITINQKSDKLNYERTESQQIGRNPIWNELNLYIRSNSEINIIITHFVRKCTFLLLETSQKTDCPSGIP